MTLRLLSAAALSLCLAVPAVAEDPAPMSDAARAAFRAEVRAYLLENPEVLMEAIAVLEERREAEAAEGDRALIARHYAAIFEDPASWSGGNPEGNVTLVEFIDYRCSYCRRAHDEVSELIASDGNIRLVVKEFPILGDASVVSSRFAIATLQLAGPDAYKRAHDELITLRGEPGIETLTRLATDLGLDAPAILARMDAPEVTEVIAANHSLATAMQINGTPTFVIGDTVLRGYVPLESMQAIVAEKRKG